MALKSFSLLCGTALALLSAGCLGLSPGGSPSSRLARSLTFHASFDHGADADFAKGDPVLYSASSYKTRASARPAVGGPTNALELARGQGRFGDAVRFTKRSEGILFYQVARNFPYRLTDWNGTVSFWLSVDPANDLSVGFCDPVHITSKAWNDAAFFVEFEKRTEVPFRLGAYADFAAWNPSNRKWEEIPPAERPLLTIPQPPFGRGQWTHVAFTFSNFNTSRPDGVARLYLNGELAGTIPPRWQTFTWDEQRAGIMLGIDYIGLLDELAIFDRELTAEEIRALHTLPEGVSSLRRKP